MTNAHAYTLLFSELSKDDVPKVGGKNASLGEMTQRLGQAGIHVPQGFATTAQAYRDFLSENELTAPIETVLADYRAQRQPLESAGAAIRALIDEAPWPPAMAEDIRKAYRQLAQDVGTPEPDVAVRSSATAEDLPDASFAGQHDTYLNIRGEAALLDACRRCLASLFTDRAIIYRDAHGFEHMHVALSVGVQRMVRSDIGGAGVMFSIDTETGFPDMVLIDAVWGLGETLVQGSVDPDAYQVYKPLLAKPGCRPIVQRRLGAKAAKLVYAEGHGGRESPTRMVDTDAADRTRFVLSDDQVLQLARWAVVIEQHYGMAMDIEWALDGHSDELFIVQARPETVQSQASAAVLQTYRLTQKSQRLVSGNAIGTAIAVGPVCRRDKPGNAAEFPEGGILVTSITDPDWVPIMKRAAAIVTDHGGRTSHAAIVSRELGLPAIVGTGDATRLLKDDQQITVSCAEGDIGHVYAGILSFDTEQIDIDKIPETRTDVMLILADPAGALRWWRLPADGVGLARMEFVINNHIKIHPMALVNWATLEDADAKKQIDALTRGWDDKQQYFVDTLARGIGRIAASRYPKPVILRMSDFKTNEYARLIGGEPFEPKEENPMLGWRGASRYYSPEYAAGFALECRAVKMLREELGFDNVIVMIPFCRTPAEADRVLAAMGGAASAGCRST